MTLYAEVFLPLPFDHGFTYLVPAAFHQKVKEGSRVLVPFKDTRLTGFVGRLRRRKPRKELPLREIIEVLDEEPVFSPSFLSFTRKLSQTFFSSWGEILQASLPPAYILKTETSVFLKEEGKKALRGKDLSREERGVLVLLEKREYTPFFLKRKSKIKNFSQILSRLEKRGWIEKRKAVKKTAPKKEMGRPLAPTQLEMDFSLDAHSLRLADEIVQRWRERPCSRTLLYGEPEKREAVYFYLIKKVLERRKKVLFLVPEISLTRGLIGKFEKRLGEKGACLHSRLSESRREAEWKKIKEGEVDVVVGPRSALLSPISDIGLIIVDEEQDESYYQRESPSYEARRGAWLRAKEEGCSLVYGSAFPSVESFYRARKRGDLLSLKDRSKKPRVVILDGRKKREIIPQWLRESIEKRLENNQPILIFINRRGYASFLYCASCNTIPRCPQCEISLTYHKREGRLLCHYCNHSSLKIESCPVCGKRMMRLGGLGIEVLEEELKKILPLSRVVCFDTDVVKTKREQEKILQRFREGKIDILIGTQLLAHQVGLPSVPLVVVFFPETTLSLSDFKATQKTYHLLIQMMKFVDDREGEIIIQTAFPRHFAIRCAAQRDYLSFYRQEIKYRRLMNYPPFSHMAEVLFRGESLKSVARKSRQFYSLLKDHDDEVEILGPALISGPGLRGKGAIQVILKSERSAKLDNALRKSLQPLRMRRSVWFYE